MDATTDQPGLRIADLAQSPTGAAWEFRVGALLRQAEGLLYESQFVADAKRQTIIDRLELLVKMRENHEAAPKR